MSDIPKLRNTASADPGGKEGGALAETDRRAGARHSFAASAEVVEISSGARFSTRMTDLSDGGCFVDTMVPFPVGAKVHIKVCHGKNEFETDGAVVYSQYGLGMGVAFDSLDPERRKALDHWIQELTGELQSAQRDAAHSRESTSRGTRNESAHLARLVQVMIAKGILTEAEGASILHDPLL